MIMIIPRKYDASRVGIGTRVRVNLPPEATWSAWVYSTTRATVLVRVVLPWVIKLLLYFAF